MYIYIVIGVIIIYFVFTFNRIITAKNMVKEAFSGIDVQLKRRHDLIPNLLEALKGYASHEKSLFENIANTRYESINESNARTVSDEENQFTQSLKSIFAIVESYPELKANNNFLDFQKSLTDTEDQLQYARRYYNGTVRDYNILIEKFPSNILASILNYKKEEFFEIEFVTQRSNAGVNFENENK